MENQENKRIIEDLTEYDSKEALLEAMNNCANLEPHSRARNYFKNGEYLGSESLEGAEKGLETEAWFTARKEADEYIDVVSDLIPLKDNNNDLWYAGYADPK